MSFQGQPKTGPQIFLNHRSRTLSTNCPIVPFELIFVFFLFAWLFTGPAFIFFVLSLLFRCPSSKPTSAVIRIRRRPSIRRYFLSKPNQSRFSSPFERSSTDCQPVTWLIPLLTGQTLVNAVNVWILKLKPIYFLVSLCYYRSCAPSNRSSNSLVVCPYV